MAVSTRERLHRLIDKLPERELRAVLRFIETRTRTIGNVTAAIGEPEPEPPAAGRRPVEETIAELRHVLNAEQVSVSADGSYWSAKYRHGWEEIDPVLVSLYSAPFDDEPDTPAETAAVEAARQEVARGETVSLEELRRELGW
jgi:hypothetical protein